MAEIETVGHFRPFEMRRPSTIWHGFVEVTALGVRVLTNGETIASVYMPGDVGYSFWKDRAQRDGTNEAEY